MRLRVSERSDKSVLAGHTRQDDAVVITHAALTQAYDLARTALMAGTHVVLTHPAIMAAFGEELAQLATAMGATVRYEAAVTPGLGALEWVALRQSISRLVLAAPGPAQAVLQRMTQHGEDVYTASRALGRTDVPHDALFAQRAAAFNAAAFGAWLTPASMTQLRLEEVTQADIRLSLRLGCRLVWAAVMTAEGVTLGPHLVPQDSALAQAGATTAGQEWKLVLAGNLNNHADIFTSLGQDHP